LTVAVSLAWAAPMASGAPTDPIQTVPRLTATTPEETASITAPAGTASLATTMTMTNVSSETDIVFILDNTGSMSYNLAHIGQAISDLVANLDAAGGSDLAFGIYFFGDVNDHYWIQADRSVTDTSAGGLWILPLQPLSATLTPADITTLLTPVSGLIYPYTGGGDDPEDAILAGDLVAANAGWRTGSQRELVLATDADSHVRTCPTACVNGNDPTLADFQANVAANNVNVTIVNAAGYPAPTWPAASGDVSLHDLITTFGEDPTAAPATSQDYLDFLSNEIILQNAAVAPIDIVPTLSVTYDDGTASTDVTASVTPAVATQVTPGGASVAFTVNATAADAAALVRPSETTTVYVEYTVQTTGAIVARQTITFAPLAAPPPSPGPQVGPTPANPPRATGGGSLAASAGPTGGIIVWVLVLAAVGAGVAAGWRRFSHRRAD